MMLLKSKVCFTVLAVYEIIAVSALHFKRVCDAMFPTAFCDSWFRYFLFCVAVPLLVFLIFMWIREIVRTRRRRRFIRRARNVVNGILASIRGRIAENIDWPHMEKIITAAILVGIKKYADSHPGLRRHVSNIMDVASGEMEIDIMATEAEAKPIKKRTNPRKTKK